MSRIIGQEGADTHTSRNIYKAVIQANLQFGAESWVMSARIRRALSGFHQGGPPAEKNASEEGKGGQVNLCTSGCGYEGSGDGGAGDICPPAPE